MKASQSLYLLLHQSFTISSKELHNLSAACSIKAAQSLYLLYQSFTISQLLAESSVKASQSLHLLHQSFTISQLLAASSSKLHNLSATCSPYMIPECPPN
jgi:uncharacterized membrane protein